jgi:predicted ATP-dependent endonuclease of OLD family
MIVSRLEIAGFRGIHFGDLRFDSFTTLFGANNCGKTTITELWRSFSAATGS